MMRKATLPKVERVNRLEGQLKGGFLDVMMGEVFSPQHFYIQVSQTKKICESVHHMNVLQLKDPGSEKPGYELDDLVDDMEDAYSKLSDMDQCIPLEELTVSLLFKCYCLQLVMNHQSTPTGGHTLCSEHPR